MESAKEPPPQAWKEIMRWRSLKYGLDRFSTIWHLYTQFSKHVKHLALERCSHVLAIRISALQGPSQHGGNSGCQSLMRSWFTHAILDPGIVGHLASLIAIAQWCWAWDCCLVPYAAYCCYFRRRVAEIWILTSLRNLCTCWRYEAQDAASSQNAWGHGRWICERDVAHDDSTIFLQESSLTFDLWMKQNGLMYVQYMYSAVYTLQVPAETSVTNTFVAGRPK